MKKLVFSWIPTNQKVIQGNITLSPSTDEFYKFATFIYGHGKGSLTITTVDKNGVKKWKAFRREMTIEEFDFQVNNFIESNPQYTIIK